MIEESPRLMRVMTDKGEEFRPVACVNIGRGYTLLEPELLPGEMIVRSIDGQVSIINTGTAP